jgi:hypothetical protein
LVESEIPVILSLLFFTTDPADATRVREAGGHAVTLVGHTFDLARNPNTTELDLGSGRRLEYCTSSEFVPAFIAQDDSGGPFRMVQLLEPEDVIQRGILPDVTVNALAERFGDLPPFILFDENTPSQSLALLNAVLVPLPSGVTLSGYWAEQRALGFLRWWMSRQPQPAPQTTAVVRTFLKLSNEVKDSFMSMQSRLGRRVRSHLLSRWTWVTEVSDLESLRTDQVVIGQVLQDSAGGPGRALLTDVLAFNFPSLLVQLNPDGSLKVEPLPDYEPYPQFSRRPA